MPGMDGWTALGLLKSEPRTASIPVVMVSMLEDRDIGMKSFIEKGPGKARFMGR